MENLRKQYEKETNSIAELPCLLGEIRKFPFAYVEWLEKKIEQLKINKNFKLIHEINNIRSLARNGIADTLKYYKNFDDILNSQSEKNMTVKEFIKQLANNIDKRLERLIK